MWMVFLILWIVTIVVGLGATGYGLYQLMEEPLQAWREKRGTKSKATAASKDEEPAPGTVADADEAEEESPFGEDAEEVEEVDFEEQGESADEDEEEFENLTMSEDDIEFEEDEEEQGKR